MSRYWCGMALPWKGTLASLVESKDDKEVITSSIIWIIMTRIGERVMRPEFGSDVSQLVFELNNDMTLSRFEQSIKSALDKFDDRVEVVGIKCVQKDEVMECTVTWKMRKFGTFDTNQTVFQFSPERFML